MMVFFRTRLRKTLIWQKRESPNLSYFNNTLIYNLSSGPHITRFLTVVAKKRKKFPVNVCFETSEYSVQTADDNREVISLVL